MMMWKKIFKQLFYVVLFVAGHTLGAQEAVVAADSAVHAAMNDSTSAMLSYCNCPEEEMAKAVTDAPVDLSVLDKLRKKREFQYDREVHPPSPSFFNRFIIWLLKKIFGSSSNRDLEQTKRAIYWILSLIAFGLLVFWIYKSERFGSPLRRSGHIRDGSLLAETEKSEDDIEAAFRQAMQAQKYPLAIRWLYIKSIKQLSEAGILHLRQDKTNFDYYLEIQRQEIRTPFLELTRLFEYSNYGDFKTDAAQVTEAQEFLSQIHKGYKA